MREIVLDTETTGLNPFDGHRMVEIGCVELMNQVPTGKTWHHYINPERNIDAQATAVHGITNEQVKNKPIFGELIGSFLDFLGDDSKLVIHNAEFDMKFINFQLNEFGFKPIDSNRIVDTLLIARKKFPGSPASLDALCRRFNIDLSGRELHGALLDAQLLADVYLELCGGRQHGLGLAVGGSQKNETTQNLLNNAEQEKTPKILRAVREFKIYEDELKAHEEMKKKLKNALWK